MGINIRTKFATVLFSIEMLDVIVITYYILLFLMFLYVAMMLRIDQKFYEKKMLSADQFTLNRTHVLSSMS